MLALWPDSQLALAEALVAAGKIEEAKPHFDSAMDLSRQADFRQWMALSEGTESGNYAAAVAALGDPQLQIPQVTRAALLAGYQALASRNPQSKSIAVQALLALAKDQQSETVATMLAALGANREALVVASQRPWLFWNRSMRAVREDPEFPAVVKQLGLMRYWKATHTKPDVCQSNNAPAFCRMI